MIKFIGGMFVSLFGVITTLIMTYDSWQSIFERNFANKVAIELASVGVDVSAISNATSGEAALKALGSIVREIKRPAAPIPDLPKSVASVLGPTLVLDTQKVYTLTEANIPVIIEQVSGSRAYGKVFGNSQNWELTETRQLPAPVENCRLTLISTSEKPPSDKYVEIGRATFTLDCS